MLQQTNRKSLGLDPNTFYSLQSFDQLINDFCHHFNAISLSLNGRQTREPPVSYSPDVMSFEMTLLALLSESWTLC